MPSGDTCLLLMTRIRDKNRQGSKTRRQESFIVASRMNKLIYKHTEARAILQFLVHICTSSTQSLLLLLSLPGLKNNELSPHSLQLFASGFSTAL